MGGLGFVATSVLWNTRAHNHGLRKSATAVIYFARVQLFAVSGYGSITAGYHRHSRRIKPYPSCRLWPSPRFLKALVCEPWIVIIKKARGSASRPCHLRVGAKKGTRVSAFVCLRITSPQSSTSRQAYCEGWECHLYCITQLTIPPYALPQGIHRVLQHAATRRRPWQAALVLDTRAVGGLEPELSTGSGGGSWDGWLTGHGVSALLMAVIEADGPLSHL